jgi:hypothetical protein
MEPCAATYLGQFLRNLELPVIIDLGGLSVRVRYCKDVHTLVGLKFFQVGHFCFRNSSIFSQGKSLYAGNLS